MRGISYVIACTLIVTNGYTQEDKKKWNYLFKSSDSNTEFFLVNNALLDDNDQVVRRLDATYSIVKINGLQKASVSELIPVNNDWKLNINHSKGSVELVFYLKLVDGANLDAYPLEILDSYQDTYVVRCAVSLVHEQLKHDPGIIYISSEGHQAILDARVLDLNLNPNRVNKIHHFYPELSGAGRLVSIQENRYSVTDIDLRGRSVETDLSSTIEDNHATAMATIIAGAGNSFVTGRGVAAEVSITSSDFSSVLPDEDIAYRSLEVITQNHSYGTEVESFYGAQAQAFDQSAFNNPNLIHVFSVGNSGFLVSSEGAYTGIEGYANLTGNFKMAKNVLVVGSVDTVGNEVSLVSRGPAYDGRVKPELVAYSMDGSSNSAALVSGVSILMQQEYEERTGQELPSALLKALLINGAEDVGPDGLDFVTGYGSVDAFKSINLMKDSLYIEGSINQGANDEISITLPSNAVNLKVTLCWTDLPSDIGSFKALVNDLDLSVINSSMDSILPWVLDTSASADALGASAARGVDRLNNIEQVSILEPEDTNYTIRVNGFEVEGTQPYYIVYSYDIEESFEWDYPTGSDNMPYDGETGSYFRWKSQLTATTATLEYSLDDGVSWIVLGDQVDLALGFWRWNDIPEVDTDAIARLRTESNNYTTEAFTISNPTDISVGFVCSDSLRLQWNAIEDASSYDVYSLGTQKLELLTNTSDTAMVLTDVSNTFQNTNFRIVPRLDNGKELISSLTIDYTLQGIECFIFSFFQQVELDAGIYLDLTLGTTYGIEQVTFQRKEGSDFTTFSQVMEPGSAEILILDEDPIQGNNTHRVVVDFVNGEQVVQDAQNTFYLTEIPLIIFPNPVVNQDFIRIVTKELASTNPTFKLFDSKGAQVVSGELLSTDSSISLNTLGPGVYYYQIEDGQQRFTGQIIKK